MRRFNAGEVLPHAQNWHRQNGYIPLETIATMGEIGVFGLTVPEEFGGMGLGKECDVRGRRGIVARHARGRLARHPLRHRRRVDPGRAAPPSSSAAGCRRSQPARCCRRPCSPSRTRAPTSPRCVPARCAHGDVYKVYGNKTWITHPVRADLMVLLVRTDPKESGYRGLSLLLAEKPRGTDAESVPGRGPVGQRDRGDRLSRHEGIRTRASTASR